MVRPFSRPSASARASSAGRLPEGRLAASVGSHHVRIKNSGCFSREHRNFCCKMIARRESDIESLCRGVSCTAAAIAVTLEASVGHNGQQCFYSRPRRACLWLGPGVTMAELTTGCQLARRHGNMDYFWVPMARSYSQHSHKWGLAGRLRDRIFNGSDPLLFPQRPSERQQALSWHHRPEVDA